MTLGAPARIAPPPWRASPYRPLMDAFAAVGPGADALVHCRRSAGRR